MEFLHRSNPHGRCIGLLAGAWNPPTLAHLAMATAALARAGEVTLVLPRRMPHKEFAGFEFERRARWLAMLAAAAGISAAVTEGGLFLEMARECRALTGVEEVFHICGRDAAERIVAWDYGAGGSIERQLQEYQLLVAPRGGAYQAPAPLAARVHSLDLGADWHDVSSSEVRRRMAAGESWAHLVPAAIADEIWSSSHTPGLK